MQGPGAGNWLRVAGTLSLEAVVAQTGASSSERGSGITIGPGTGVLATGQAGKGAATEGPAGTPQLAWWSADPCVGRLTGNDGGAPNDGVTPTTITLSCRELPESTAGQEMAAPARAEGYVLPQATDQVMSTFLDYLNQFDDFHGPEAVITPAGSTSNRVIPPGTDGIHSALGWIFDALQAAGPDSTPANLAEGVHALPALGAPDYSHGRWDLSSGPSGVAGGGDHTLISDARFVSRDGTEPSPDNAKTGARVPAFNAERFSVGQAPTSQPALFTS